MTNGRVKRRANEHTGRKKQHGQFDSTAVKRHHRTVKDKGKSGGVPQRCRPSQRILSQHNESEDRRCSNTHPERKERDKQRPIATHTKKAVKQALSKSVCFIVPRRHFDGHTTLPQTKFL